MRHLALLLLAWMLTTGAGVGLAAGTGLLQAEDQREPTAPDTVLAFRVEIGSPLYPNWKEEQRLHLDQLFYLGDSEFTARIRRFVPDFRIGEKGEILSVSSQLNNPAVQVVIYHDSTATDSTWAFLNFPPHYSARSFFTFQLKEIAGYRPAAQAPAPHGKPGAQEAASPQKPQGGAR